MTTSGNTDFSMDFNDIAEEAFERCGAEIRSGYDLRTARRSLNLLTLEWANKGINMWTIEQGQIALVAGQATYSLPVDTIDLIEHTIRTGDAAQQVDIAVSRISVSAYSTIPNKTQTGRPIELYLNRQSGTASPTGTNAPTATLWPVPDNSTPYTLVYWRLRRMQSITSGVDSADVPFRFLPALIAGLAFHLSLKIPGANTRTADLKVMYDEAMQAAMDEDREKAPLRIVPRGFI